MISDQEYGEYDTGDFSSDEDASVSMSSSTLAYTLEKCTPDTQQEFEATEHKYIGDRAFDKFIKSKMGRLVRELISSALDQSPLYTFIQLPEGPNITPGDWVALAGDFYGVPEEPISGGLEQRLEGPMNMPLRKERFLRAYNRLARLNRSELDALIAGIDEEDRIVKEAKRNHENVFDALQTHAAKNNTHYAATTADSLLAKLLVCHLPLALVGLGDFSQYLELAKNNYDHFGQDAELAYEAGHETALDMARLAGQHIAEANAAQDDATESSKTEEARILLLIALTQELFACHFLTDLFASGHMRVPRRELALRAGTKKGALFSLMMHNEDGDKGLMVHQRGDDGRVWRAQGDGCLLDKSAEENLDQAIEAVQESLNAIAEQFKKPSKRPNHNFREYIPSCEGHDNHAPLFQINAQGQVEKRKERQPVPVGHYQSRWHVKTALPYLLWHGKHKHTLSKKEKKALARELETEDWNDVVSDGQHRKRCSIQ